MHFTLIDRRRLQYMRRQQCKSEVLIAESIISTHDAMSDLILSYTECVITFL
jgi:hypothetical protein